MSYTNFVMGLAHYKVSVVEHRSVESKGLIPHEDSEFFVCPTLATRRKPFFSISSKLAIFFILLNLTSKLHSY